MKAKDDSNVYTEQNTLENQNKFKFDTENFDEK